MITIDETNIECCDESSLYNIHKSGRSPRLIIGYRIETKYDHTRHKINDQSNPTRVSFISRDFDNVIEWYYIYGIELSVNKTLKQLHHNIVTTDNLTIDKYYEYLELYDLTCDTNFLLLRKNLYIIDNHHLSKITNRYKSYKQLKTMLTDPDVMFYQNCDDYKIFLIL